MEKQISVDNWGKDHWSLLIFFETQVVDNKKQIDVQRIRINEKKRGFTNGNISSSWKDSYGTIQKDGSIAAEHDDIDVMNELEAEGLCVNNFTEMNPIIELTEKGFAVVADIRKHKARGGNVKTFLYQELKYNDYSTKVVTS